MLAPLYKKDKAMLLWDYDIVRITPHELYHVVRKRAKHLQADDKHKPYAHDGLDIQQSQPQRLRSGENAQWVRQKGSLSLSSWIGFVYFIIVRSLGAPYPSHHSQSHPTSSIFHNHMLVLNPLLSRPCWVKLILFFGNTINFPLRLYLYKCGRCLQWYWLGIHDSSQRFFSRVGTHKKWIYPLGHVLPQIVGFGTSLCSWARNFVSSSSIGLARSGRPGPRTSVAKSDLTTLAYTSWLQGACAFLS